MIPGRKLVRLTSVKKKPMCWLWRDRIPLGAVTVLDGDPGQSKSTLTYDLAARVTTGRPMLLCKGRRPAAGVVLIQAEDSLAGKVKPTLKAAGANLKKIRVYDKTLFAEQPLVLPDDVPLIEEAVQEVAAKLVVLDPLSAFLGGEANSDQSVRKALGPLAALAERNNCAIVIARHLTKHGCSDPLYRGIGSIGIIALARSGLWVTDDPGSGEPHRHVLTQTKTNLSMATSVAYRTVKQGDSILVEWIGESNFRADDLADMGGGDPSRLQEAVELLRSVLEEEDGEAEAKEVYRVARESGVAKRTLDRAKTVLGIRSLKKSKGNCSRWVWQLPEEGDCASRGGGEAGTSDCATAVPTQPPTPGRTR